MLVNQRCRDGGTLLTHGVSDFRQAGLKRQKLNFGALNPCVAICRFMQLYECHSALIL
jgi:hypothetical protein